MKDKIKMILIVLLVLIIVTGGLLIGINYSIQQDYKVRQFCESKDNRVYSGNSIVIYSGDSICTINTIPYYVLTDDKGDYYLQRK